MTTLSVIVCKSSSMTKQRHLTLDDGKSLLLAPLHTAAQCCTQDFQRFS
jgi:hypothetical protein